MDNEVERIYAKTAGTIPAGFTYTYDGDTNAKPISVPRAPVMNEIRSTIRAMVRVGELSQEMATLELQQLLAELSIPTSSGTNHEITSSIENTLVHSTIESRAIESTMVTGDADGSAEDVYMNEA
jgi:hypothetical protein